MQRRTLLTSFPGLAAGLGFPAAQAATGGEEGTVAFTVSIRVKAGHEEEFLRLVTPVLDAMRHEASFINAVLHRDPEDPGHFMLYETWTDLDDVAQVQIHRDYRRAYWERLPQILREEREVRIWQPLRSDFAR